MKPARNAGHHGKIPARGDFVSAGLPSAITRAWDQAISAALAGAKSALSDRWTEIWLEAPVWRFALPADQCGPYPLLGLWMPSIDKAGRHFPLMIATTCPGAMPEDMARHGAAWLDEAERAGRAALIGDLTPEGLQTLIPPPPDLAGTEEDGVPFDLSPRPGAALWWTDGSPLVPSHGLVLDSLPDPAIFATMLEAGLDPSQLQLA